MIFKVLLVNSWYFYWILRELIDIRLNCEDYFLLSMVKYIKIWLILGRRYLLEKALYHTISKIKVYFHETQLFNQWIVKEMFVCFLKHWSPTTASTVPVNQSSTRYKPIHFNYFQITRSTVEKLETSGLL